MQKIARNIIAFGNAPGGSSAVEFALVVPVFLMLLFGIVIFGAYLGLVHDVQQLAAEAARSSVAGLSESERTALATTYVTTNAASYPLIDPSRLKVNAATSPADPNVFIVALNYDASGSFIYSLPSFVGSPSSTIVRSAAIPRGGY